MMKNAMIGLSLTALIACGESKTAQSTKKSAPTRTAVATDTDSDTGIETGTGTGTADPAGGGGDEDFGVAPFLYGPYLAEAFSGGSGATYAVEFGFLDIRRQNGLNNGPTDIFDFRWKTVAATASSEALPSEASSGCSEPKSKTFGNAADTVEISGATSAELEPGARNVFLFENVEQGAKGFDATKGLAATFIKGGDDLLTVNAAPPPGIGSVRVSGAYDATLNINTSVRFLSDALKVASDALRLSEDGGGAYDLAVVTLLGGAGAKAAAIRCYLKPGGSVELTEESYKSLLPLRGFYVTYAKIQAAVAGGASTWSASIVGDGAYDQTAE